MARHWSERAQLTCSCGHVSRSMAEEARHRHNFPMLCRKPKPKKSPCVGVCRMEGDRCVGCGRTLAQIEEAGRGHKKD